MEELKQIKYNRLKVQLKNFLGTFEFRNHYGLNIDNYINEYERSAINIIHSHGDILVNPSIVKSDLPKEIVLEITQEFIGYKHYTISWMY